MMWLTNIINLIFILCSVYISYLGFKGWFKAKTNHDLQLNVAISYVLLGVSFLFYIIDEFYHIKGIAFTLHFLETYIFYYQLKGILITTIVDKSCNYKKRKTVRLIIDGVFIMFMAVVPAMFLNFNYTPTSMIGLQGLQIIGCLPVDIYVEMLHVTSAFFIFWFVPDVGYFILLRYSYLLFAISDSMQIANILLYNYTSMEMFISEWILCTFAVVGVAYSVYKIIKKGEKDEE